MARGRFNTLNLSGTFFVGNAEQLNALVPIELYDLVYAFGILHHTPDPVEVLRQAYKYMHPESELRFMVYAEHSWKAAMIDAGLDQPEAQANCPLARRYTHEQIDAMLAQAHFEVTRLWQDHVFPYRVAPYKHYRYEVEPWFGVMSPEMFRALEVKLGWHTLVWARPLPQFSGTKTP
jgi:SAM-dependent methyltransferase